MRKIWLVAGAICCVLVGWASMPTQLTTRGYILKPPFNSVPLALTGPLSIGLCCMWPMNEGGGDRIWDSTRLTVNLSYGAGTAPAWISSPYGSALKYVHSGAGYFLNGGAAEASRLPHGSSPRTYAILVQMVSTSAGTDAYVMGQLAGGAGQQYLMAFGEGGTCAANNVFINVNSYAHCFSWTQDTQWHILAAIYPGSGDSSAIQLYMDGTKLASSGTVGSPQTVNTGAGEIFVGGNDATISNYAGAWIWSRALSQPELQSLRVDPWQMLPVSTLKTLNGGASSGAAPPFGIISQ